MWRAKLILAVLVAALFLPLYDHDVGSTPLFTKAIFLQVAVLVAAALWVPLAISDRRYRPDWRHPLVIASTLWLFVNAVAAAAGVDPFRSLWSTLIRMTGVFGLAHLWLLFLMLTVFLRERGQRRLLTTAAVVVSVAVSLLAWRDYFVTHSVRVSSVLDNAGFLGGYAAVAFWLCLYGAVTERRYARGLCLAAAALSVTTIGLSGSRGPLVALAVSLVTVGLAAVFTTVSRRWRWPLAGGVILASLAFAASFLWFMTTPGKAWVGAHLPPTASRVLYANVGEDRLALWQVGWQAFLERPWLGWGPENYQSAFDSLVDPINNGWMLDAGWYDRPHNMLVERLANLGIVGLLATLVTLGAVLWVARRRWLAQRATRDRLLLLTVVGALIAYGLHVFFLFEVPNVSVLMLLALGLLATATGSPPTAEPEVTASPRPALWVTLVALAVAAPIVWYGSVFTYRQTNAFDAQYSAFMAGDNDPTKFAAILERPSPASRDLTQKFVDRLRLNREAQPSAPPEWRGLVELGRQLADSEAARAPHDYRSLLCAAAANRLDSEYDSGKAASAERYLDRAFVASPRRLKAFEERGELRLSEHDYARAVTAFSEALRHTAIRLQTGRLHARLAEAWLGQNQVDHATREALIAVQYGYGLGSELRLLVPLTTALEPGRVDQIWIAYIERIDPQWATRRAVLAASAVIYAKAGLRERAEWMLEELMYRDEAAADALEDDVRQSLKAAEAASQ